MYQPPQISQFNMIATSHWDMINNDFWAKNKTTVPKHYQKIQKLVLKVRQGGAHCRNDIMFWVIILFLTSYP